MISVEEEEKLIRRDSGFQYGCPKCAKVHFMTKKGLENHLIHEHKYHPAMFKSYNQSYEEILD